MKFNQYFKNFAFAALILFAAAAFSSAQTQNFPAPRESKLLNGTRLLVWNDTKTNKVTVKIRVHSGSAFDQLGKEGMMQLLSDILFPIEQTKEFFAEDLNGSFEIVTNYDYIQINASGDADKFLTILETLAAAITNPSINKESTERVRAALLAKVQELGKNPSYIADQAVAKRLLGNFPYGRPQFGSTESLAKIDFADLIFARERFLTADNATIAISGNVNPDFALRAAKRLFGGWLKADKKVPATFAQPDAPNQEKLTIKLPNLEKGYTRTANNAPARNDKNFYSFVILDKVWQKLVCPQRFSYQPHLLRGIYVISGESGLSELPINECSRGGQYLLIKDGKTIFPSIPQNLFDEAKSKTVTDLTNNLADLWLDVETYKLNSVQDELQKLNSVSINDVQKIAENLLNTPSVSVVVTASETKQ
jgi:predicted Zn-dependent peptidase